MRIVLLIISTLLLSCVEENNSEQDPWVSFLESPSQESEGRLLSSIKDDLDRCDWGRDENKTAVPDEVRQELFGLIRRGDISSLRVGITIEKCLDGGDLGDFRRSTGQFFDRKPSALIDEALKLQVSPERFSGFVTALPLELVDDPSSQIELLNARKSRLEELLGSSAGSEIYGPSLESLDAVQESVSAVEE